MGSVHLLSDLHCKFINPRKVCIDILTTRVNVCQLESLKRKLKVKYKDMFY